MNEAEYSTHILKTSSKSDINIIWNKTYGGNYIDAAQSIINSNSGGYIISGWTNSSGAGDLDIWILRISEDGDHIWNKTLGGAAEDKGFQIINYSTGGFAIAATYTNTSTFVDNKDCSVVRVADDGNIIWHKNYSGPEQTDVSLKGDLGRSIVECTDGDFVLAGVTNTAAGNSDVWLFRIGPNGLKKWDRTYHHWDTERCYTPHSLVLCDDGGFAIACYTYNATLSNDVWLIRTDPFGIPLWNKTYGVSSGYERPESIVQCTDGGFGIIANTQSFGAGATDGWFIRTDASGNQLWNKTFGGTEEDGCSQALEMSDGGFALIGSTHSFDIGNGDGWIIRIDSSGDIIYNYTIGDPYGNGFSSFFHLGNNTFVATGTTYQVGMVHTDLWVIKFQVNVEESEDSDQNGIPGYNFIIYFGIVLMIIVLIGEKDSKVIKH
ncbi:MAG: hypothetical protein EU535_07435 [Promethearchaeota archaeon]|nr:MAG: hypothetical protein EU535_07435 [Candidatus Lokiarchaeota archaeon]